VGYLAIRLAHSMAILLIDFIRREQ